MGEPNRWLIHVKIGKDEKLVQYVKMIRDYDKTVSIGDLKRKIDGGEWALTFDFFGYGPEE